MTIFRFELVDHLRRPGTWLSCAIVLVLAARMPFSGAALTVLASMAALLVIAGVAAEAATRDVQSGMESLVRTTPMRPSVLAAQRFLAAWAIGVALMLVVSARSLTAFASFGLPNAFIATALLFAIASAARRAVASYLGAAMLVVFTLFSNIVVAKRLGAWGLGKLLDPFGLTVMSEWRRTGALPVSSLVLNRVMWIALALTLLAMPRLRVRFARMTQLLVVARESFVFVIRSWGVRVLAAGAVAVVATAPLFLRYAGVPMLPTTKRLATLLAGTGDIFWVLIPLLIVLYAGELVWRERDERMDAIANTLPASRWLVLAGKTLGLVFVLVMVQGLLMITGVITQLAAGYTNFELPLYVRLLFGAQLGIYALFAMIAVVAHVLVNQKYAAHLVLVLLAAAKVYYPANELVFPAVNGRLAATSLQVDLRDGEAVIHGTYKRAGLPDSHFALRQQGDVSFLEGPAGREHIAFDATISTAPDEIAIAPGTLRRTWLANGRRYFHYVADVPIRNSYAICSGRYSVLRARWNGVDVEVDHHGRNAERILNAAVAALATYSRRFGAYPYRQLRLIEVEDSGVGLHSDPINIWYTTGFAELDPRDVDFPYAVLAHEIAHQWWGNQLTPRAGDGEALLTESLAWYSALGAVEETRGSAELQRVLGVLREEYAGPESKQTVPLLRANDRYSVYRRGPFALWTLRERIGQERVDLALRRLLQRPSPTPEDLFAELEAVTPPADRALLTRLFRFVTP